MSTDGIGAFSLAHPNTAARQFGSNRRQPLPYGIMEGLLDTRNLVWIADVVTKISFPFIATLVGPGNSCPELWRYRNGYRTRGRNGPTAVRVVHDTVDALARHG